MDKLIEELNNSKAKITFGLTPHNIEVIEKELERFGGRDFDAKYNRYIWDKLGKELSWEPFTLCLYYFEYLEESGAAGKKIKISPHELTDNAPSEACTNTDVGRMCRSCETEWKDDFWCNCAPSLCLNCCPNAFGQAECSGGKCKPIENTAKAVSNDDLAF
jgi:hypothetical protein